MIEKYRENVELRMLKTRKNAELFNPIKQWKGYKKKVRK